MHRGLKSAAAASASGNIDRAIFVFLFSAYGSRLPPIRAVDITVGLVYIIPRYRNNYIPSIYIVMIAVFVGVPYYIVGTYQLAFTYTKQ